MALDLHNALAQLSRSEALNLSSDLELGGWRSPPGVYVPITFFRFARPPALTGISSSLRELLELNGVLAISGAAQAGSVHLSGGSVCSTGLRMGKSAKVVKTFHGSALPSTDAIDRHMLEFSWMSDFQRDHSDVFPRVGLSEGNSDFAFELEFFPAYSLGELFLDGLTDPLSVRDVVMSALKICHETLHHRKSSVGFESYVEKVRRRLAEIVRQAASGDFFEHIFLKGAIIDGRRCRPLKSLLEICEESPYLASLLNCRDPRYCHGDLIPEDILYSRYYRSIKLVDPNPQICDPLADFSKLQMSFDLRYDLALRNLTNVASEMRGSDLFVELSVIDGYGRYESLQDSMGSWLPEIVSNFVPEGSLEPERFNSHAVRLMAALQALAIPIFHLLQHKQKERSQYFFAKGHYMLELAVSDTL